MEKKKWIVSFGLDRAAWIAEVAKSAGLNGSTVIDELVTREMRDKNSRFRHELAQSKLRLELQKLNDEQMDLEARRAELTKQMKGERIAVPA